MEEQLERIIQLIYAAAVGADEWSALLTAINTAIGAVAGFYAGLEVRQGRGAFWYTVGHDHQMAQLYNEHYLSLDPTLTHIVKTPGKAFACSEYLSESDIAGSRFHSEFLIPNGMRYVLSGVVSMQGSMISLFGFQRLLSQAPFSRAETDFMQRLIPHFAMADQVAAKVGVISDARRLAMTVLDRMDYGIVIVSPSGQIRMSNHRAELWLESGSLISSHLGRIRLAVPDDNAALIQLIRAAGASDHRDFRVGAIDTVGVRDGMQARILVLPIEHEERRHLDDNQAQVTLIITDINQQRTMAPHLLQQTYGLTQAETKVAVGLASGKSPDELAESLFISLATVKTHTQHIYQKVGLGRQAELVRLVYGLPPLF
ncbi:hypothetical protein GTP44_21330 [Duganella sp. FT50W]|uniref:HTH luxR-type domain-containing protein n=1 Tax=Duganella lactea TaxID=2692173 RepID=A0A6L8MPM6_9BURK|nr:helix-turn-helix transcriptional regulator [Duganella lactea]MYM84481.1 hypothetical protein [Duganella lactea]